jgi:uncharacterized delta-60 repeat protein
MSACLRDRTLILGLAGVLSIVAPGAVRVVPGPIGGPTAPSTKKSSGDLDVSFAGTGAFWTLLGEEGTAVAVDAGGGIVVAAHSAVRAFAILRYNSDGTLDTTFGSNGVVAPFDGLGGQVRAMVIQPDGRIVAGGFAGGGFALARLLPDGSYDASFGSGGQVLSDVFPGASELALAMALQADGRIVLAGQADGGAGIAVTLARYNSDGSLDATFGAGGVAVSGIPGAANAVAVQPDGRIVVAGLSFLVTRFDADGTLDAGFGSGGSVAVPFGPVGSSEAFAILVQPDGRIVAAGATYDAIGESGFALARLDPDGTLDKGFGHGGMVTTDFYGGPAGARALILQLQSDGRLVAAGEGLASRQSSTSLDFALARYETTGALDRSFGKSGRATADIGGSYPDMARALAAQPDGRLVAAGTIHITNEVGDAFSGIALARFLP